LFWNSNSIVQLSFAQFSLAGFCNALKPRCACDIRR
jgi:hypothetical protein